MGLASFRAYSTTVLFLLLQRIIPIDGFSPSIRTVSSKTDSKNCIFPTYSGINSETFSSTAMIEDVCGRKGDR